MPEPPPWRDCLVLIVGSFVAVTTTVLTLVAIDFAVEHLLY